MSPTPNFLLASLNFTHAPDLSSGLNEFLAERSLIWTWLASLWTVVVAGAQEWMAWLEEPHQLAVIAAWWITFTVVVTLLLTLGFGPAGIVVGSLAAAFQSFMYGGFTPAGGIFATLTMVGMTGFAMPVFALLAGVVATVVAVVVSLAV